VKVICSFSAGEGSQLFHLAEVNIGAALHFLSPKVISIKQEVHEAIFGIQRSFSGAIGTG
jgi:hypothetical protein